MTTRCNIGQGDNTVKLTHSQGVVLCAAAMRQDMAGVDLEVLLNRQERVSKTGSSMSRARMQSLKLTAASGEC